MESTKFLTYINAEILTTNSEFPKKQDKGNNNCYPQQDKHLKKLSSPLVIETKSKKTLVEKSVEIVHYDKNFRESRRLRTRYFKTKRRETIEMKTKEWEMDKEYTRKIKRKDSKLQKKSRMLCNKSEGDDDLELEINFLSWEQYKHKEDEVENIFMTSYLKLKITTNKIIARMRSLKQKFFYKLNKHERFNMVLTEAKIKQLLNHFREDAETSNHTYWKRPHLFRKFYKQFYKQFVYILRRIEREFASLKLTFENAIKYGWEGTPENKNKFLYELNRENKLNERKLGDLEITFTGSWMKTLQALEILKSERLKHINKLKAQKSKVDFCRRFQGIGEFLENQEEREIQEMRKIQQRDLNNKMDEDEESIMLDIEDDLDVDQTAGKDTEELQIKEREELQAKLKNQEKKVDYFERAKRLEEIPLLLANMTETQLQEQDHKLAVAMKERLSRIKIDTDEFLNKFEKEWNIVYEDKLKEFETTLSKARIKRLLERKINRKEDRRARYLKEKQEKAERKDAEKRKREEQKERVRILKEKIEKQRTETQKMLMTLLHIVKTRLEEIKRKLAEEEELSADKSKDSSGREDEEHREQKERDRIQKEKEEKQRKEKQKKLHRTLQIMKARLEKIERKLAKTKELSADKSKDSLAREEEKEHREQKKRKRIQKEKIGKQCREKQGMLRTLQNMKARLDQIEGKSANPEKKMERRKRSLKGD